jgi:hypothetical protein
VFKVWMHSFTHGWNWVYAGTLEECYQWADYSLSGERWVVRPEGEKPIDAEVFSVE